MTEHSASCACQSVKMGTPQVFCSLAFLVFLLRLAHITSMAFLWHIIYILQLCSIQSIQMACFPSQAASQPEPCQIQRHGTRPRPRATCMEPAVNHTQSNHGEATRQSGLLTWMAEINTAGSRSFFSLLRMRSSRKGRPKVVSSCSFGHRLPAHRARPSLEILALAYLLTPDPSTR